MSVITRVAERSRPLRRVLTPSQFKETHINRHIATRSKACYLEIGVRTGESFRLVKAARKIGVDPCHQPFMGSTSEEGLFYEMTSDEFFADYASTVLGGPVLDVAPIDGLHEFGQALRDFLNVERYMKPDGVVFLDDCNPSTREKAEVRDGGAWNGDVWRVAALLVAVRPDLEFVTLDCDQGLGMARGFSGAAMAPLVAEDIARFASLDYDALATDRARLINLRPVATKVRRR